MNPKVDLFLEKANKWKEEMVLLRTIALSNNELTEDYKWLHPCYTLKGKNVVLIHQFKEYCALLFHKGALMKDPEGVLVQITENVQAARQLRFTSVEQIKELESVIKDYINEAIEIEKSGKKVALKKPPTLMFPINFKQN
jgi:uncharacterized protein YdeI (YjbR/CyaY-like superfamily)